MTPLEDYEVYPSEAEAEEVHSRLPFRRILALVVREGIAEALESESPVSPKRYRRIGPYGDAGNASSQASYVRRRHQPYENGTFKTKTEMHSDGSGRAWLLVRFEPNGAKSSDPRSLTEGPEA